MQDIRQELFRLNNQLIDMQTKLRKTKKIHKAPKKKEGSLQKGIHPI
jgi:hypothetical protein